MADAFDTAPPVALSTGKLLVPELAPPPRTVPMSIQWQLLDYRVVVIVGGAFVLVSLLGFIVPQIAAGHRFESPWQLFPFLHLAVGLGMVIVPLVAWRRRVAILKQGVLAPARIVALQDQGRGRATSEQSYGVRNVSGPWLDFEIGFPKAQRFWASTIPTAPAGSINPVSAIMNGFGCVLLFFGAFTVLFFAVGLTLVWISGNQTVAEKAVATLLSMAFLALYLAFVWFGRRWTAQVNLFATGQLPMGQLGIPSTVRCRFVYSALEGGEKEAIAYIDLGQRLQTGQATPADLVVYLPDEPQRALLLGGLWPPLLVQDGEWVRA